MRKLTIALAVASAFATPGCTYVLAHKTGVELFAVGAGAVAAGENALLGAWNLADKAEQELNHKEGK
jgi:hypothetical protein